MSKENKETQDVQEQIKKSNVEKIEKIKSALENLKEGKSKFLFCVPDSDQPSALLYEIYFHANVVSGLGYETYMMTETEEQKVPEFIEKELTEKIPHISMQKSNISIGPEDFMVISELHTNVMEQTKKLPCKRIGLLQSFDYMLNSVLPGVNWKSFGVTDVITTSETLKNMLIKYYGKGFYNIKTYNIGIPDYFERTDKPQKPIISLIGRNSNEMNKIIKLFYSKYPHFNWVTFDPMLTRKKPPQRLRRKDFANRLKENFAGVWIDRISSFGTFPLECMKTGTIPICLKPDITPPYIHKDEEILENVGYWTINIYDLPEMIGDMLTKFLDDNIPDELYDGMYEKTLDYTPEKSKEMLNQVYVELIKERTSFMEEKIKEFEK